jgi:hypothetical protein
MMAAQTDLPPITYELPRMTHGEVLDFLQRPGASGSAARWVREHKVDMAAFWADCAELKWMLWLLARMLGAHSVQRWFAAQCARHVLHIYENGSPRDDRPRRAIATVERYARGLATGEELFCAKCDAGAAGDVTRRANWAAASAAWAAAGDVTRVAAAAAGKHAAWAARAAAEDAAGDADVGYAAWGAEREWQRDYLRSLVSVQELEGDSDD